MLKFIDESDFLKVDTFKENEDGSVAWRWQDDDTTHSGVIFEGFTRTDENRNAVDVWAKLWELHNNNSSPVNVLPVDIGLLRNSAKQTINAQRDALISGGVEHNGHTFQTDATSVTDMMGAILSGDDTQWLTADNQTVVMSAADMQALGNAVATHKKSFVYKARVHKDNIGSLTTKADIDAYMGSLSWG